MKYSTPKFKSSGSVCKVVPPHKKVRYLNEDDNSFTSTIPILRKTNTKNSEVNLRNVEWNISKLQSKISPHHFSEISDRCYLLCSILNRNLTKNINRREILMNERLRRLHSQDVGNRNDGV